MTSSCNSYKSNSTGSGSVASTVYFNSAGWIITMQFAIDYLNMQVLVYKDWSGGAPNGFIKFDLRKWYINCGKRFIIWGSLNEFLSMGA